MNCIYLSEDNFITTPFFFVATEEESGSFDNYPYPLASSEQRSGAPFVITINQTLIGKGIAKVAR